MNFNDYVVNFASIIIFKICHVTKSFLFAKKFA